jgi:hypothetical protein
MNRNRMTDRSSRLKIELIRDKIRSITYIVRSGIVRESVRRTGLVRNLGDKGTIPYSHAVESPSTDPLDQGTGSWWQGRRGQMSFDHDCWASDCRCSGVLWNRVLNDCGISGFHGLLLSLSTVPVSLLLLTHRFWFLCPR